MKDEKAVHIDRNLELAQKFLPEGFDDVSVFDEIPEGSTIVLVPDNDEDLASANIAGALEAFKRGENVYLRHVSARRVTPTPVRAG